MKEVFYNNSLVEKLIEAEDKINEDMDYWMMFEFGKELINKPTQYRGKGRPRKTDYALYKHPADGRVFSYLNTINQ